MLLVLSQAAVDIDGVEDEVSKAYAEERERKTLVLFPIRIDDSVMTTNEPWARKLRDQRHIGDFLRWTEPPNTPNALNACCATSRTSSETTIIPWQCKLKSLLQEGEQRRRAFEDLVDRSGATVSIVEFLMACYTPVWVTGDRGITIL